MDFIERLALQGDAVPGSLRLRYTQKYSPMIMPNKPLTVSEWMNTINFVSRLDFILN